VAFARSLLTIAAGAARLSRHYPRGAIEWAA
jgi:hypothetical protein